MTLSGTFNGNVFVASMITFEANNEGEATPPPVRTPRAPSELGLVTLYGTVAQPLSAGSRLVITDSASNRSIRVYAEPDLVVRGRTAGYTTADRLRAGDNVALKVYRDAEGNYIAQTIRLR